MGAIIERVYRIVYSLESGKLKDGCLAIFDKDLDSGFGRNGKVVESVKWGFILAFSVGREWTVKID